MADKDLTAIASILKQMFSTGARLVYLATALNDANNNESIKTVATASAVNELTVTNAAAGGHPILASSGDTDANIGLRLQAKGSGAIVAEDAFVQLRSVAAISTAGAGTYSAANIVGGLIDRDCAGADRTDTTATAAQIVAALPGVQVGSSFVLTVKNISAGANTITVAGGTGVTISGTATIAQNNTRQFLVLVTSITTSSEAVVLRSLGTSLH